MCRNTLFTGSYFAFASVNKSRHFHSLIIMSIDKSFENSIENILNQPYLNRIYVSCINIELLSVWTRIRTCFSFDKAVKLATMGRHDCRFSVSNVFLFVSRLLNILLLFKHKRDILYTGNVEYILLCLCLEQKNYKD